VNLEIVEVLSSGAGPVNEDCVGAGANYAYVVDGASGLYEQQATSPGTDAAWFATRTGQLLDESLPDDSQATPAILRKAMAQLRAEFESKMGVTQIDEDGWPSASLSVVRTDGDDLELYQLGDCVTLWQTMQGAIDVSHDLSVPYLDRGVVARQVSEALRLGISVREARAHVGEDLKHNRSLRNRAGGYWSLDLGGAGIDHAQRIRRPADNVKSVVVMSDGFWTAVADLGLYSDASALSVDIERRSVKEVLGDIRRTELDDPELSRYPRLKRSDDASAVHARVV
jgi:hypothetical protein